MRHPRSPHPLPSPYIRVEALIRRVFPSLRALLQRCTQPTAWPIRLPLFTCQAVGGDPRQAEVVAAAFELARLAARVLDDVEDLDREEALWREVGVPQATNAGTALLACAHLALAELTTVGVEAELISELQREFAQVALAMSAAQHLDLTAWEALDATAGTTANRRYGESAVCGDVLSLSKGPRSAVVGEEASLLDRWWEIAAGKSGAFFALGCRAGARLGASHTAAQPYSDFGYHLGLLLQVLNDSRGLLGQGGARDLGRRLSLPVAYTLAVCPEVRSSLLRALDAGDEEEAVAIMGRAGAVHYLLAVAETQRAEAIAALDRAQGDPVAHQALLELLPAPYSPPASRISQFRVQQSAFSI